MARFPINAVICLICLLLAFQAGAADRFLYSGQVVNERGEPVGGAEVIATHRLKSGGHGYIDHVATDDEGKFTIDRAQAMSGATVDSIDDEPIRLDVKHDDYLPGRIGDLHQVDEDKLATLKSELKDGRIFKGRDVGPDGKGIAAAMVQAEFEGDWDARKAKISGDDGSFELRGLKDDDATLSAIVTDSKRPALSGKMTIERDKPTGDIILNAKPAVLPPGMKVHELFGMKLIDVNEQIQEMFLLPAASDVMVLDPGTDSKRLGIGTLQRGDSFWIVGDAKIKNFDEFTRQLVTELHHPPDKPNDYACRIVYRFTRPKFSGTNTQEIHLQEKDLETLKALEQ
jgi:hypothetical protein